LPPGGLVLLGLACLLFLPPRWGRLMAGGVLAALLVLGMPLTAGILLASLDPGPDAPPTGPPQAIVILSGDAMRLPDPNLLDPGPFTLERLRAGAALHRRTGLPILVSGGRMPPARMPLAEMMAISLAEDFQAPVRWREEASRSTWENAQMSAALLREAGVERVLLVTHAWHMRRSLGVFRHFGLEATAAPVRPLAWPRGRLGDFIPQPSGWQGSHHALHEWIGIAFYRLRN
jgi:uncharacterized SAM-binding protein YcdF (DUF218 family)